MSAASDAPSSTPAAAPAEGGVFDDAAELVRIAASLRAALAMEGAFEVEELTAPGGLPPKPRPAPPAKRVVGRPAEGRPAEPRPPARPAEPPRREPLPARPPAKAADKPAKSTAARPSEPARPAGSSAGGCPAIIGVRGEALLAIARELEGCTRCRLSQGRKTVVFGDGSPTARLFFVGEGPGADEDAQGLPFVGAAGQLLDKIIEAMGLRREDVYIGNVVKCRPPGNRTPMFDEVETCGAYLARQLDAVKPEVIVALGATAARMLLGKATGIGALRGSWHDYRGTPVRATYHPAYLLRSPGEKRKVWEDMKVVMARLGLAIPGGA